MPKTVLILALMIGIFVVGIIISLDVHLDPINEEIEVIKRVVNENKEELEQVIEKLSQMESKP